MFFLPFGFERDSLFVPDQVIAAIDRQRAMRRRTVELHERAAQVVDGSTVREPVRAVPTAPTDPGIREAAG